MRFGICLPYMERAYDRATILAWCRRADAGPFYSLSCGESINGYTFEMRVLLAAAAAVPELSASARTLTDEKAPRSSTSVTSGSNESPATRGR